MIIVRLETQDDICQVRILYEHAFEQAAEARVVDKLRLTCPEHLALVADDSGTIAGHILFTPSVIEGTGRRVHGMGLAPMAVMQSYRKQGIGSRLVERGLEILRARGCPYVIVLGHPEYYPHFGFELASKYGLVCQWEGIPDEAFMVAVLDNDALTGISGVASYRSEFDEAM